MKKKIFAIGGAVVLILVITVAILLFQKPTIDMDKYLSVTLSGYNTYGVAKYNFDYAAFEKDHGFRPTIDGSLDKTENLTNGDVITFTWNIDAKAIEETNNCKINYFSHAITVANLPELITFDPFADLKLSFANVAPYGSVSLENNSTHKLASQLQYQIVNEASIQNHLSNGDKVEITVSLPEHITEEVLRKTYGIKGISSTGKIYVAEGIGTLATEVSHITDAGLTQMKTDAEAAYKDYATQEWTKSLTLRSMEYQDLYLLQDEDHHNRIVLVYKATADIPATDTSASASISYYTAVIFRDGFVTADNSFSIDKNSLQLVEHKYYYKHVTGSNAWEYDCHYLRGYKDLDSLFDGEIQHRTQ